MKTKNAFRYEFEENFVSLVKSRLELSEEASVQQIVEAFQQQNIQLWNELGQRCGVTAKKVHDYYHNTWLK